jgi:hypothetical protein
MTVEVKIIPEGKSGLPRGKRPPQPKPDGIKATPTYHQFASSVISSMQQENRAENKKKYTPAELRKVMASNLRHSNPNLSVQEIRNLVDQYMPQQMTPHTGKKLVVERSEMVDAVWATRKADRQKVVKANKRRRKMR